ncbi:caspase family protein [Paraburkholderia hospita]|uniref:caspase family protein n=1 Tax=Paraburkholderia hospita TaxID=169430 RepID=UPI000B34568F|nr:caspase family protein [Paraburkholderia hospita]OUL96277.1 hypothetical protein CA601_03010 [Paraburkholderia hospita]
MERRDFLAAGFALTGALAMPTVRAQSETRRAAVIIGVDQPVGLPRLRAARTGARTVADWLQGEGFDVKLFVDGENPVKASDIVAAITDFVNRGTLEQLVVYFAGHGFISGTLSEFWLLSGAPENPNEAISLAESCANAELSGIPNVVFISDACRSRADSLAAERVHGTVVFPSRMSSPNANSEVDQFLATRIGAAAYEVSVIESSSAFEGIYTACFLDAYKHPYSTMVQTVDGKSVVPNRRLKSYLAQEVPKRAQARSIRLDQRPDSKVYSDEPTYIAHVSGSGRTTANPPAPTVSDVATSAIWSQPASGVQQRYSVQQLNAIAKNSGFESARNSIVQARGLPGKLSTRSGFAISGQKLEAVVAQPGIIVKFANSTGNGRPTAFVEVDLHGTPAASLALRFSGGSGTVLAALDGFIGNVVIDGGNVSNVSYVPSRQNPLRSAYESEADRLEQLHAEVATAARFGVFRIEGPRDARQRAAAQLADRIRLLKGIDPTLGLYAAYAYADAGLMNKVASVHAFMRDDLHVDLFDVAMLAGKLSGRRFDNTNNPVPICPMLSQGWGLLRVKDIRLPEGIVAAREHLRVSLWATFDSQGMQMVERVVRAGSLT